MVTNNIIIIGAPRSGTNMLRDVLASLDGVGTWPCDEINYIWRHGNVRYPSDEIPASRATPEISNYIRSSFNRIHHSQKVNVVIEKTCANCLRVPFVDRVVPGAKFIYIHRDGIDVAGSAKLRWTAKLDIPYLVKKVRFVPITDLPYYGFHYLWSRLYRLVSKERRLAFWGPKLDDMQAILENHSLNEVCAIQWKRCVDAADKAFSAMAEDKVIRIRYENFVTNPQTELRRVLDFMELTVDQKQIELAVQNISCKSLGKGRSALGEIEVTHLEGLLGDSLSRYGYLRQ